MNDMFSERNHYLIIPVDEAQRLVTERIEKISRSDLLSNYKIRLNAGYTTTITVVYIESCIRVLSKLMKNSSKSCTINFLDLLSITSTNRENEDADKDGNINIKFAMGPVGHSIMEQGYCPVITEDMWANDEVITTIEREASYILNTKHKLSSSNTRNYTKIAYCYISYLFKTLKLMAMVAKESGSSAAMINFLELFEAHATVETTQNPDNPDLVSEKIDVKLRPGFQAKLLIKDDGITESDFDDE